MPSTIGVALRQAVTDGLKAHLAGLDRFRQGDREVEVLFAWEPGTEATAVVYTGRSRADTPPAAMRSGRNYKDERGTFDLSVLVRTPGASPLESDSRAVEIGTEVEEWIGDRKSNQIGVEGLQTITVTGWASDYRVGETGAITILTYEVTWTARIT